MSTSRLRFLWPLAVFVALVAVLGAGLQLNPREVPSPLVGKPAPAFQLATQIIRRRHEIDRAGGDQKETEEDAEMNLADGTAEIAPEPDAEVGENLAAGPEDGE